jgi:glycosyltransferase involved in cell wall biosynthesis
MIERRYTTAGQALRVALVGGPDVDARLDLMTRLQDEFEMLALGSRWDLQEKFAAAGFTYYPYRLARQVNPFLDLLTVKQLWQVFRQIKPQIVHTFDTKPNVVGRMAARMAKVPIVVGSITGLGSLYTDPRPMTRLIRQIYEPLQKLASRQSDLTIFHNQDDCEQLIRLGIVPADKAKVIPGSGVRTDLFQSNEVTADQVTSVRSEFQVPHDGLLITTVSRLIRSKGLLELSAAACEIRERYPQVRFALIGGTDHAAVDRLTSDEIAQMTEWIRWIGPSTDIRTILAASDIFVLPTYREGISRVLIEAASMGLPLIATDVPGCREIVAPGTNGLLVPPRDGTGLVQAIEKLIKEPELRHQFGVASRHIAVEHFDLGIISQQIATFYRELLMRLGK